MGEILVGTSSWTDPTLVKEGNFYPREASSAEARLRFYATQFPLVEVDSTYYFPPTIRNSELWIERTPPDFTFNIKAYSLLTGHPTKPESMPKDLAPLVPEEQRDKKNLYGEKLPVELMDEVWERFHDALMPLHSAGKLGVVLFQFPQWFVIGDRSRDTIIDAAERLDDFRIAIEFRHGSWLAEHNREKTFEFLEENDLPFVAVDMPQGFESSVPPVAAVTADDISLVRFHGRNTRAWDQKGITASERFRYLYEEDELRNWVGPLKEMASETRETHVLMNNCYRDYAVRNAREMGQLILE